MTMHERRRCPGWARGSVALVQLAVALALPVIFVTQVFAADATSPGGITCSISQVTNATAHSPTLLNFGAGPSVSATGARIVFRADIELASDSLDHGLFLFDVPTGMLTQLTTLEAGNPGNFDFGISDDGNRIAFASSLDLVGQNPDLNTEIFLLDLTSGTFTQITRTTGPGNTQPATNGDGTRIVFRSNANLTGENADGNIEVFLFDTTTGQFTQVTRTLSPTVQGPASMSGSGTRIVFTSSGNFTGENPDSNSEVFLFDSTTGAFTQITAHTTIALVFQPKISDNGTRIAFSSSADLTGENPDPNVEAFVFDTTTGTLTQLTRIRGLTSNVGSLDATGRLITLSSSADFTGENPFSEFQVFVLDTATGEFTQITRATGSGTGLEEISDTGTRIAFIANGDLTGSNPDGGQEIFLATCGLVNELVSLAGLPDTFQTSGDTSGCPAGGTGKFSFFGRLTSLPESPTLTDLQVQVLTLTNDNLLQNADGGPGGIGATLTVQPAGDYADGALDSGEAVEIPFVICLHNSTPFQFFVDVKGSR